MLRLNARRGERGFTLIEVLLVMTILVVLASFVLIALGPINRRYRVSQAKTQIGMFKTPLDMYNLDIGSYPGSAEGLQALLSPPPGLMNPTKWQGPYIDADVIPMDPWGNYYQYTCPGQHHPDGSPDIWTISPDGQEIGNWTSSNQ
jgi:general secretion pathway protein G